MKALLLIILGLVYAASGLTAECPEPYHAVGNGCYTFPNITGKWIDASTFCQFSGGYLAKIDSSEEQSALKAYHDTHFNNTIDYRWLGATDSLSDGIWRWVPSGATVDYNNWASGEPWAGATFNCACWSPVDDYWTTHGCCADYHYPLCETMPL